MMRIADESSIAIEPPEAFISLAVRLEKDYLPGDLALAGHSL